MTLTDIINKYPFCKQASSARYDKACREWARREKLRTGDKNGDFKITEKPRAEYPRPQMERSNFDILNGSWDYAVISASEYVRKGGRVDKTDGKILVPFSPECDASGVGRILDRNEVLIYRTSFNFAGRGKILLHFEAVDEKCEVFVNGVSQGVHEGGYLPFYFDVTSACREGANALEVHVVDFSDSCPAPKGKQTLSRGGIWYTPQSGIWGTVWTETVPENYIENVVCLPDPGGAQVNINITACGDIGEVTIKIYDEGREIISAKGAAGDNVVKLGAIKEWSPSSPFLYKVLIKSESDSVRTYFAMRKIELVTDMRGYKRVKLNGEYIFQSGVLDQGYYPESMLTPPSDRAMINDIQTMKDCGFNMIRKHIKIEPARWYYHCDRLGMLVWQDMVSGGDKYNGEGELQKIRGRHGKISALFPFYRAVVHIQRRLGTVRQRRHDRLRPQYRRHPSYRQRERLARPGRATFRFQIVPYLFPQIPHAQKGKTLCNSFRIRRLFHARKGTYANAA